MTNRKIQLYTDDKQQFRSKKLKSEANYCEYTKAKNVYLGSSKCVFKSMKAGATWTEISSPSETTKNRGVAFSPNGKVLYAAYATNDKKGNFYATSTATINWTKVAAKNGESLDELAFWYPEVDPRSTGDTHKVILSLEGSREGLYEGTFDGKTMVLNPMLGSLSGAESTGTIMDGTTPHQTQDIFTIRQFLGTLLFGLPPIRR